jgi:hypothetical protein
MAVLSSFFSNFSSSASICCCCCLWFRHALSLFFSFSRFFYSWLCVGYVGGGGFLCLCILPFIHLSTASSFFLLFLFCCTQWKLTREIRNDGGATTTKTTLLLPPIFFRTVSPLFFLFLGLWVCLCAGKRVDILCQ